MRTLMRRLLLCVALAASLLSAHDADLATRAVSLLEQRCFVCHSAALAQSGLRLNSRDNALQGGVRGPAIVAGNASQNRVVQSIRRTGELSMPPGPKLADAEIATPERGNADRAPWPTAPLGRRRPRTRKRGGLSRSRRSRWFQEGRTHGFARLSMRSLRKS